MIRRNFLHNLGFVPFLSLPSAVGFFEPISIFPLDTDQQHLITSASEVLYGDHLHISDRNIQHKLMQPIRLLDCKNGERLKFINKYNQVVRILETKDGELQLAFA